MKRIAFVTYLYTDSNFESGGVKLNYLLVDGLKNAGYHVDLFCSEVLSNVHNLFENIYPFNEIENNRDKYDFILSDKASLKSDITYIHDHSYPFRAKKMFSPLNFSLYKIFKKKRHLARLNDFYRVKENLANTKLVVVSSKVLKEDMIENYGVDEEKIVIIHPPIEKYAEQFPKTRDEKFFTFGLCAVGFQRKGGYIALNAINKLKNKNKNFKLKIIYPKNNFFVKLLVKLYGLEKYCEFLGIFEDMSKFYNSIDCLIMPSVLEPFGMVTTEALACGVPAIVPTHCGACDAIENGYNGIVYDAGKNPVATLVKAMKEMLDIDEEKYSQMSKNSLEKANSYTADSFTKEYLKLLTK